MKLYGIPNCNTVKKARQWLNDHALDHTFHDFKKDGINAELLSSWLRQVAWEKLVNRAGMTWRGLSADTKADIVDSQTALQLMLEKPSVIKRPLLIKNGRILHLGFNEAAYQTLLK